MDEYYEETRKLVCSSPEQIFYWLYPRIFPVHKVPQSHIDLVKLKTNAAVLPDSVPCSLESIRLGNVYIVDNGYEICTVDLMYEEDDDDGMKKMGRIVGSSE